MVRTRSVLIAVVALGLGAGACKKKEEAAKGGAADKMTEKGGEVTKAAPSGGVIAGADDLSLLPADSEIVMGLNFAQLQQSALWKQFAPKLMEKAAGGLAARRIVIDEVGAGGAAGADAQPFTTARQELVRGAHHVTVTKHRSTSD